MRRTYGLAATILFIIATGTAALGQAPRKAPRKVDEEDVAATAAVLDHVWLNASHNSDGDTMDWLFADDFIEIHPGGLLADKRQQIDQIRNPQGAPLDIRPTDIQVRYASPDAAVLTDTTIIHGKSGDVTYDGQFRVIRVFSKLHGRWRAAGAGIARITAQ
jgi:ketosteroid isomerase-like protein